MKIRRSMKKAAAEETRPSKTDPLGSYTGRPADPNDMPEQDADDL